MRSILFRSTEYHCYDILCRLGAHLLAGSGKRRENMSDFEAYRNGPRCTLLQNRPYIDFYQEEPRAELRHFRSQRARTVRWRNNLSSRSGAQRRVTLHCPLRVCRPAQANLQDIEADLCFSYRLTASFSDLAARSTGLLNGGIVIMAPVPLEPLDCEFPQPRQQRPSRRWQASPR